GPIGGLGGGGDLEEGRPRRCRSVDLLVATRQLEKRPGPRIEPLTLFELGARIAVLAIRHELLRLIEQRLSRCRVRLREGGGRARQPKQRCHAQGPPSRSTLDRPPRYARDLYHLRSPNRSADSFALGLLVGCARTLLTATALMDGAGATLGGE